MKDKTYKELVILYYEELWNEKNKDYIDLLFDDDITFRASLDITTKGKEEFEKYMDNILEGIPDLYHGVEVMLCENNIVAARANYHGVHTGQLFDFKATGKLLKYSGASFFKFRNGKIYDIWVLGDLVNLYKQLNEKKD